MGRLAILAISLLPTLQIENWSLKSEIVLSETLGHPSFKLPNGKVIIISTGLPKSVLFREVSENSKEIVTVSIADLTKAFSLSVTLPLPGDKGVVAAIGYDILKSLNAVVSYSRGKYRLSFNSTPKGNERDYKAMPLNLLGGVPTVMVSVGGIETRTVLESRQKIAYLFSPRLPDIATEKYGVYFKSMCLGDYQIGWPRFVVSKPPDEVLKAKIEASVPIRSFAFLSWRLDAALDRFEYLEGNKQSQDEFFLSDIVGSEVKYVMSDLKFHLPGVKIGKPYLEKTYGAFKANEGWYIDAIGTESIDSFRLSEESQKKIIELIDSRPLVKMHIFSNQLASDAKPIEGPPV
jgi:hypothetical protein